MLGLLALVASLAAAGLGYYQAREFVRNRLRYVDAVQKPVAPIVAAIGAGLLALPVVALLPLVGVGTAIAFGISVGLGVAAGAREIRRRLPPA